MELINITWESIQNPYMPKGMVDLMAQQQAFQNSQSIVMEQMKSLMQTKERGQNDGQTENANSEQG